MFLKFHTNAMTGNSSVSFRVLANSLRVISTIIGNPPLVWMKFLALAYRGVLILSTFAQFPKMRYYQNLSQGFFCHTKHYCLPYYRSRFVNVKISNTR